MFDAPPLIRSITNSLTCSFDALTHRCHWPTGSIISSPVQYVLLTLFSPAVICMAPVRTYVSLGNICRCSGSIACGGNSYTDAATSAPARGNGIGLPIVSLSLLQIGDIVNRPVVPAYHPNVCSVCQLRRDRSQCSVIEAISIVLRYREASLRATRGGAELPGLPVGLSAVMSIPLNRRR
jgi:hypothetical protein